jgi:hypothetical protein
MVLAGAPDCIAGIELNIPIYVRNEFVDRRLKLLLGRIFQWL